MSAFHGQVGFSGQPSMVPGTQLGQAQPFHPSTWFYAMDPESRKLRIPAAAVEPTRATERGGSVALCQLYLQGRCRQGHMCNQLHAAADIIHQLRNEAVRIQDCCQEHGDPLGDELRRAIPASVVWKSISVSGALVPPHKLAMTKGLQRAYLLEVERVAAEPKSSGRGSPVDPPTPAIIDPVESGSDPATGASAHRARKRHPQSITVSPSFVCKLHPLGRCKFGEECRFAHVCREAFRELLSDVVALSKASEDTSQASPERSGPRQPEPVLARVPHWQPVSSPRGQHGVSTLEPSTDLNIRIPQYGPPALLSPPPQTQPWMGQTMSMMAPPPARPLTHGYVVPSGQHGALPQYETHTPPQALSDPFVMQRLPMQQTVFAVPQQPSAVYPPIGQLPSYHTSWQANWQPQTAPPSSQIVVVVPQTESIQQQHPMTLGTMLQPPQMPQGGPWVYPYSPYQYQ